MVPPFYHEWIIAGREAGLEILDQHPDLAAVTSIGGGGLAAGVSAAIKLSRMDVKVIGVEPAGAAAMKASIEADVPSRSTDGQRRGRIAASAARYLTFALVPAL